MPKKKTKNKKEQIVITLPGGVSLFHIAGVLGWIISLAVLAYYQFPHAFNDGMMASVLNDKKSGEEEVKEEEKDVTLEEVKAAVKEVMEEKEAEEKQKEEVKEEKKEEKPTESPVPTAVKNSKETVKPTAPKEKAEPAKPKVQPATPKSAPVEVKKAAPKPEPKPTPEPAPKPEAPKATTQVATPQFFSIAPQSTAGLWEIDWKDMGRDIKFNVQIVDPNGKMYYQAKDLEEYPELRMRVAPHYFEDFKLGKGWALKLQAVHNDGAAFSPSQWTQTWFEVRE